MIPILFEYNYAWIIWEFLSIELLKFENHAQLVGFIHHFYPTP